MTIDEIIQLVRASVDEVITVKYKSGEVDVALVLTVDDEGFVYDLACLKPEDRKTEYWTPFSEIAEVQRANSGSIRSSRHLDRGQRIRFRISNTTKFGGTRSFARARMIGRLL
jgi:DNA-directed RNA polymerase subunit E'/Rpb7